MFIGRLSLVRVMKASFLVGCTFILQRKRMKKSVALRFQAALALNLEGEIKITEPFRSYCVVSVMQCNTSNCVADACMLKGACFVYITDSSKILTFSVSTEPTRDTIYIIVVVWSTSVNSTIPPVV